MSYFAEMDIDTRTCGQADEDAYLDRRDGLTSHSYTRPGILAGLEAQRFSADYAARPLVTTRDQAAVLAKDLVNALDAGDTTAARRLALELRPFLGLLEGE